MIPLHDTFHKLNINDMIVRKHVHESYLYWWETL